jgi:hypothetical protein
MADDFDFDFPAPQEYAFPPAEMILELAKGLEKPVDIAERYGYNAIQYAALENWEPFRKEYERMVSKLEAEGVTYRNKAILYATDLIDRVYAAAKRPDVPLPQLLEAQKLMSKAADLDPKTAQTTQTGATYSVKLVLKDLKAGQTIEGEVVTTPPQLIEAKDDDVGTDI